MMLLRKIIIGLPVILILLTILAFWNATRLVQNPQNVMMIGMLGEASNLNPILSTDASSFQVSSLIFQALLSVDENMNLIGELAQSWTLRQKTTFFFPDKQTANAAAQSLRDFFAQKNQPAPLFEISSREFFTELQITHDQPGLDLPNQLAEIFQDHLPVTILNFDLKDEGAAWCQRIRENPAFARVVRSFSESKHRLEVAFVGHDFDAKILTSQLLDSLGLALADSKIISEEKLSFLAEPEILFHLREGVCWQDGHPFSADDVLFTYSSIMDDTIASPRKSDFTLIGEITKLSDQELLVRYRRPYSPALNSWRMAIIPAHILKGKSPQWWAENFNRKPIGTGPFRLAEWKTNEYIRLERNPNYWRNPAPWLDAIIFRVLPDPITLRLAFETRQVDFWSVDPWAVKAFLKDNRFDLFRSPTSTYTYVGWNLRKPIFQDIRIRKALAHAVDVSAMIRYLLYGYGSQSNGIFTPQMWFYDPSIQPLEYNPEKARRLLAEAGWMPGPDGILQKDGRRFEFTLITNNANEIRRDAATLLQDNLRKVGISVSIELYEWAVLISRFVHKAEFDAILLGWSLPQDDFDQFQIWHSSQTAPAMLNIIGFESQTVDTLLEKLRSEFDRQKILELASQLQREIYSLQPYLFLFVPEATSVMWRNSYRVCRPLPGGDWLDEPVRMTKAGWTIYLEWFYRPEFSNRLPQSRQVISDASPKNSLTSK
ncbi:MAG: ABC transporter substrate-binding protein [Chthoniobacterales bacterium]|nr:ABC transporter substrate-binding protein [Chthoniobacterales bacterium]